jgi:hypothetical protein
MEQQMIYNVGDLVVRRWKGEIHWEMVGFITNVYRDPMGSEWNRHFIKWAKPEHNIGSTGWRVGEFELIEQTDKICPTK